MKKAVYAENGVALSKANPKVGETVRLMYNGLLKNCGACEVKAHTGYNETWEDPEYIDMTLENDTFVADILIKKAGTLNCAFVDPIGNWDNNSGANYTFKITKSRKISEKKADNKEETVKESKAKARTKKTKAETDVPRKRASTKKATA